MRPAQNAGREVRAVRNGGKTAHVEFFDFRRSLCRKLVDFRRSDGSLGSLSQVVIAKGVCDNDNDVFDNRPSLSCNGFL